MLIVCPSCATSYQVEPPALGPGGRTVRCTRCKNLWFATMPRVVPALATISDLDIVDNGPRTPYLDAALPLAEASPEWEESARLAEEEAEVAAWSEAAAQAEVGEITSGPVSTAGIDLDRLGAEIEAQQPDQADVDAVLAEVSAEMAVADAPSLVPSMGPDQMPESKVASALRNGEDIETYAARRALHETAHRRRWPVLGFPAILIALLAATTILVGWRTEVVRVLPQTASLFATMGLPVNLRGLAFENVQMTKEVQDGVTVLVVEGTIVNVAAKAVAVPQLRLAVRNDGKHEIYSWTAQPTRAILGAAETLPFRSRLASPPGEARDVLVRFVNRRDVVAGVH
jgi:predicted Zn finger-like uncharacterized protein